jgi:hypothetical protein
VAQLLVTPPGAEAVCPCLAFGETFLGVAETITFRPDEETRRALAVLTQDGTPVSTAVRAALIEAARIAADDRLRAEAAELADDEADRAEAAQVLRDMETLRAWWGSPTALSPRHTRPWAGGCPLRRRRPVRLLPLSTWLVAPTSTSARAATLGPEVSIDGNPTRVMAEQTAAVDPQRLGVGRASQSGAQTVPGELRFSWSAHLSVTMCDDRADRGIREVAATRGAPPSEPGVLRHRLIRSG